MSASSRMHEPRGNLMRKKLGVDKHSRVEKTNMKNENKRHTVEFQANSMGCRTNPPMWRLYWQTTLASFFVLISVSAHAIVNVEDLHFNDAGIGSSGSVSLDVSGAKGNEDKSQIGMGFLYRLAQEQTTDIVSSNYHYGKTSDIRDSNNAFLHLRHIHDINDTKAWEVFTQVEKNEFTRLKLRSLLGGGLRKKLIDDKSYRQYMGLGLFYSVERLDQAAVTNEESEQRHTRVNFYTLNRWIWSKNTKLYATLYAQPVINDWKDYRLLGIASLKVAIDTHLSLKVNYTITRDSEPPALVKKNDIRYFTGFEYQF